MKRVLFVLAMIVSMAVGATASASQIAGSGVRRGPVAKLVELERRKNAWLRSMFSR